MTAATTIYNVFKFPLGLYINMLSYFYIDLFYHDNFKVCA